MKHTTLKDIAKELGISTMTVSKALKDHPDISDARKKEIKETAARLNYIPNSSAQSLRGQRSKLISVMVSDLSNPYYSSILKGIEEICLANGYCVVVNNTYDDPNRELTCITQLISINVAGVLLTPSAHSELAIQKLNEYKVPYVMINRYMNRHEGNYVVADDFTAGYMAASHILQSKDDTIFAFWFKQEAKIAKERMAGVQKAFLEAHRELKQEHIIYGLTGINDGYHHMKQILQIYNPPFSIVCFSDYIALGVQKAIKEFGYNVPQDISLVGIDNIDFMDYLSLSSVDLPRYDIGKKGIELLLSVIKDMSKGIISPEQHIVLNTALINRGSVNTDSRADGR